MNQFNRAFTLIEVLVVVLITGILASIAVPQYQYAVEKARASEAIILLASIAQANQVYYLANGKYAATLSELDFDIPGQEVTDRGRTRKATTYFNYDAKGLGDTSTAIASANRIPSGTEYSLRIEQNKPGVYCFPISTWGTTICQRLSHNNQSGSEYLIL